MQYQDLLEYFIYWNTSEDAYFEVFTKKKHVCPNRSNNTKTISPSINTNNNNNKPTYYKKSFYSKEPKPKMSNSLELLQGPIQDVQKKYKILSDIVTI